MIIGKLSRVNRIAFHINLKNTLAGFGSGKKLELFVMKFHLFFQKLTILLLETSDEKYNCFNPNKC